MRMRARSIVVVLSSLVVAGCGGTATSSSPDDDAGSSEASSTADAAARDAGSTDAVASFACTTVTRTCADITAAFGADAADVTIACNESSGTFTLQSTDVPTYMSNQTTPNAIEDQKWVVVIPLNPTCTTGTPQDAVASRGPVGFMINGIPFYGPQDALGKDAIVNEGPSFDDCDGHADPSCSYHYHEEPVCVFGKGNTASMHTLSDGHPPIIGFALDGFAIYASTADSVLDSCNGHSDATRGYHYHATKTSPYLVGCYGGSTRGTMANSRNVCANGVPVDGG